MKYFYALVHKDEDSSFGVTFPDLPGCFSAADRIEDIVPNACEALDLWFEDQAEVEPNSVEDIRQEVREDLDAGAFLMAIPRVSNDGKAVRVNLSLDRGMLAAIDTAALMRRLTRSAFLVEAARNEIEGRH